MYHWLYSISHISMELHDYLEELFAEGGVKLAASIKKWCAGIDYEVQFWSEWFETKGSRWPESYARRIKPQPLGEHLIKLLPPSGPCKVLDVGAGPITIIGTYVPDRESTFAATDPLARQYAGLMAKFGVTAPVVTQFSFAEDLSTRFAPDEFDLVTSRNALDHSIEPVWGILEMLIVCKLGGYVYLNHFENEAEAEGYEGFHQWNFTARAGDFIIWNKDREINITRLLSSIASLESSVDGEKNVKVAIRKHHHLPIAPLEYQRRLRAGLLESLISVGA
ncbi:MAG: hypothetical protein JSS72_11995 [Armatimonadetes bacterium]|nr:hypothetical protein [Armatimonadota bacterium]